MYLDKIVEVLENKKAVDIKIINIEKVSILADYFVICSGTSTTHIKALVDELKQKMDEYGLRFLRKEGYNNARWTLIDFGDIIVHIFHEEDRQFYDLERLWSDGEYVKKSEL